MRRLAMRNPKTWPILVRFRETQSGAIIPNRNFESRLFFDKINPVNFT